MTGGPIVVGLDDLGTFVGEVLGTSGWREVHQVELDRFAEAVGGTAGERVAPGTFVLSVAPVLLPEVLVVRGTSMGVNYGLDRAVFEGAVVAGSRVRLTARLVSVADIAGGVQAVVGLEIEADDGADDGEDRDPASVCRADAVYRYYA